MKLQEFYLDEAMRKEVKTFIETFLAKKAVDAVFANQSVTGIYEAKTLLQGAFTALEIEFKPQKEKNPDDSR